MFRDTVSLPDQDPKFLRPGASRLTAALEGLNASGQDGHLVARSDSGGPGPPLGSGGPRAWRPPTRSSRRRRGRRRRRRTCRAWSRTPGA